MDVFKSPRLMKDDYVGWGAEDSELSYKSRLLENAGLLIRVEVPDMWVHLCHPLAYDECLYQLNVQRLRSASRQADLLLREYLAHIAKRL
jgi:hypothetical protein